MSTEIAPIQSQQRDVNVFANAQAFESAQRIASALAKSTLVPEIYRENLPNCLIALEISQRIGASPLLVMQNLYVIEGRPSWSSQFLTASINACGRFTALRYVITEDAEEKEVAYTKVEWKYDPAQNKKVRSEAILKQKIRNKTCVAWAEEKATGERLESPSVSLEMAIKEGWYNKSGSKWQTMPDLMLRYRAAAFFQRTYWPELTMGLHTVDEVQDFEEMKNVTPEKETTVADLNAAIAEEAKVVDVNPDTGEIQEPKPMKEPAKPAIAPKLIPVENGNWDKWAEDFGALVKLATTKAEVDALVEKNRVVLKNMEKQQPEKHAVCMGLVAGVK